MPFPEDQHAVGEFGADGQYEAFGEAVRSRAPRRDLDHFDTGIDQYRVERGRELSGSVADDEPEPGNVFAEVHHKVAGLLGRPGSVGMAGHAEDVQVAVADLEYEQDVEPVRFQNSAAGADLRVSGCAFVLVDQSSQYWAASDPVVMTVRGGVIGARRDTLQCSVRPAAVVVGAELGEDD